MSSLVELGVYLEHHDVISTFSVPLLSVILLPLPYIFSHPLRVPTYPPMPYPYSNTRLVPSQDDFLYTLDKFRR